MESKSLEGIFLISTLAFRSWISLASAARAVLHKPHSSPSSAIRPHRLPLSPRSGKVASDLRRGQPARGHSDGGRACLLAMRVSRSVLLSVCEAVIRFQDFSQCDRPATRLCTPHPTPPRTPAPPHSAPAAATQRDPAAPPASPPPEPRRCYTSAGTCSHAPKPNPNPQPPPPRTPPPPKKKKKGGHFSVSGIKVKEKYAYACTP